MSNVPPVVSVIMPLNNSSSYIHDSVGSVQAQTFTDWELILIDDCSTDNTEALAREYARADHRIHVVVHAKNAGAPATARNTGLEHARGEFVTFLDHDDTFLPRKLERMLDAITAHKLDFCCSNIYLIHAQTGKKDGQAWGRIEGNVRQGFTRRLLEGNFVPPNSTLIRRSLFELVGNFDTTLRGVP
jgi:glycosyltransferase involved in cell wall biosynthesis